MKRKLRYFLEWLAVLMLVQAVRLLPRRVASAFGRGLGRFTFSVLRIRRVVTLDNLQHAFPAATAGEILALASRCYEHFGLLMLEYLRMPLLSPAALLDATDYLGSARESDLDRLVRDNTGAILLTAHLGNWEYLAAWLACKGYPVSFINQPQNNPFLDRLIQRTRENMGMRLIARGSIGLRGALRTLRQRRFVAILPDQDAGREGIFVPFFGRPASTARGTAVFVLKTGVPVVLCILARQAAGRFALMTETLRFELPEEWDEERKIREITARCTAAIESYIRRYPEQWLWLHRRWKSQPRATSKHAEFHT